MEREIRTGRYAGKREVVLIVSDEPPEVTVDEVAKELLSLIMPYADKDQVEGA